MRHAVSGNRFGRNSSWRKATVRDIAKATLQRQRICTTKAKAKEARKLVDRLITLGKKGTLAHRRRAFAILCDHQLVSDLFFKVAGRFRERQGGYTRIIPSSRRRGDHAQLVYLELTEQEAVVVRKVKRAAPAEAKDAVPTPAKPTAEPGKTEGPAGKKPATSPTDTGKDTTKKHKPVQDKAQSGKNIAGGIRKMFRRKTAE